MITPRTARRGLVAALTIVAAIAAVPSTAAAKKGDVDVMTRNLYLGSGLSGATGASSFQELVNEAGVILKNVDANNFPVRAKGLAQEIRSQSPDLVGLQEATLWRTGPCTANPLDRTASTVRYDYVKLLLKELNRGKKKSQKYRVVVAKDEFDFEVYVNEDGNEQTSAEGCPFGAELNGRQTMRDVILARGKNVKTKNPSSGSFETVLQVKPGGLAIDVTRGWTAVDAKIKGKKGSPWFRFVNVHFEAFDNQTSNPTNQGTEVGNGEVRLAQAKELIAGPARGDRVILVGDLNSDSATPLKPGDELAHSWLIQNGFENRDTAKPLSCCLNSDLLAVDAGGKLADFDHQVDHIMTGTPSKVKLRKSRVTGLKPQRGYWNSDHAGVWSRLNVR